MHLKLTWYCCYSEHSNLSVKAEHPDCTSLWPNYTIFVWCEWCPLIKRGAPTWYCVHASGLSRCKLFIGPIWWRTCNLVCLYIPLTYDCGPFKGYNVLLAHFMSFVRFVTLHWLIDVQDCNCIMSLLSLVSMIHRICNNGKRVIII